MQVRILISISFLLLSSCVYRSNYMAENIQVLPEIPSYPCKLVGQVQGESAYSYLAVGLDISKDRAKKQASEIGATHIVWTDLGSNNRSFAVGKAYLCPVIKKEILFGDK